MKKRVFVFLEFLIGGIVLGIIEDIIVLRVLVNQQITLSILLILFLVVLPFSFLGEYVVDRTDVTKVLGVSEKHKRFETFLEFFVFGVALGVVEDLTAFYFAVGETITLEVLMIVVIVAVPFAFVSEVLIDNINFKESFEKRKVCLSD